jgi:LSD1 subclass zinc finger protein
MSILGKTLSNILEFLTPDGENKVRCAICNSPGLLSESVADENGKPVHSACYINKLAEMPGGYLAFSNPSDYFPAL